MEGGNDSGVELLYCFDKEHKLKGIAAGDLPVRQVLKDISQMFDGDCRIYEYKE